MQTHYSVAIRYENIEHKNSKSKRHYINRIFKILFGSINSFLKKRNQVSRFRIYPGRHSLNVFVLWVLLSYVIK